MPTSYQELEHLYDAQGPAKIGIEPTLIETDDSHDITKELMSVRPIPALVTDNLLDELYTSKFARPTNPSTIFEKKHTGRIYKDKFVEL
ncbi:hypothetical protein CF327_g6389 [Tilletia walkeri]|uniref:Uncharacterized protein n=1 Tax=Tilletia walkeri TaxID=117179 RepID=A0A8X7N546_9BASI|nr:hypothetical protein CF327_g6389 [Tilletia walkeri]KAE8266567.1 hypothetical protein A4X09_0g5786 [Tilletia walkeri]